MRISVSVAVGVALLVFVRAASSHAAPELSRDPLKTLKKAHPRLLMTDERLDELKKLHKTDPLLQHYVADVLKAADQDLTAPLLKYEIPDGLRLL
ncbi:MAG: hypothetical protein WCN95_14215, partial [bacterium]